MNMVDIILTVILLIGAALAVRRTYLLKKSGGCSGCTGGCPGCEKAKK